MEMGDKWIRRAYSMASKMSETCTLLDVFLLGTRVENSRRQPSMNYRFHHDRQTGQPVWASLIISFGCVPSYEQVTAY